VLTVFHFLLPAMTAQSVVTRPCTGWAVIQFSAEAREFFVVQHILTDSGAHPMGTGVKVDRGVKVTTHLNLLKRLRMSGATSLLLPLLHSNGIGRVQLSFLYLLLWPSSLVNDSDVNKVVNETCEYN